MNLDKTNPIIYHKDNKSDSSGGIIWHGLALIKLLW